MNHVREVLDRRCPVSTIGDEDDGDGRKTPEEKEALDVRDRRL